jgi:RNA polymerase-binding transcription factor DksA
MAAPDESHLADAARVAGWKRQLLRKGGEVAQALESLLAGKDVDVPQLPGSNRVEDDKELRLRRFLELIDRGIKSAGSPRFGRCGVCGDALPAAVLDETPWLERCAGHRD